MTQDSSINSRNKSGNNLPVFVIVLSLEFELGQDNKACRLLLLGIVSRFVSHRLDHLLSRLLAISVGRKH